ncbi:MAG: YhbY family RNA-binding protein [Christensenellaceae bacterium]
MQIITSETITSKQRSKLKSLASNLQPVTQIGKGGISDNLLKTLSDALEAHELIKVSILSNAEEDAGNLAENVAELLDAVPARSLKKSDILPPFLARKFRTSRILNSPCVFAFEKAKIAYKYKAK